MPEIKIDPILNVHENYNKVMLVNPYRFSTGASYEPETVNYLAAVGIADDATVYYAGTPQEKTGNGFYVAVDTYIKSLKTEGVFSKLKAVYPMIGGSASTHKWNLMNPQDTDAAFRMLWFGAGTHSKTGFKGDGATAYGDTTFNPYNENLTINSIGIYNRTSFLAPSGFPSEIGVYQTNSVNMYLALKRSNTGEAEVGSFKRYVINISNPTGFFGLTRLEDNAVQGTKLFRNGLLLNSLDSSGSLPTKNIFLGRLGGANSTYTLNELSYAFIGEGLPETQMTAHYNAVQQLQTDLGRQV